MLKKIQYRVLVGLSVLGLILTFTDMFLYSSNRYANAAVSARAQYIQQSLQLQSLYDVLVKNLANLAAKGNDPQLRGLLASQGITFNVTSASSTQEADQVVKPENKKRK